MRALNLGVSLLLVQTLRVAAAVLTNKATKNINL